MGYDYMQLIENYSVYQWAKERFKEHEEEAQKEIDYIALRMKEKFRAGLTFSSKEISILVNYEVFPYERQEGESFDHGYIWVDYIFDVDEDEHYMMTFAWHDDYGVPEWDSQEGVKCEYKEIKMMKWVPVEE